MIVELFALLAASTTALAYDTTFTFNSNTSVEIRSTDEIYEAALWITSKTR